MATEKQARAAREAIADQLFELGAHAVAVDLIAGQDPHSFGVIAMVPRGLKANLPKTFSLRTGKVSVDIPIVVKRTASFKPE